jgi:hypothetical protein
VELNTRRPEWGAIASEGTISVSANRNKEGARSGASSTASTPEWTVGGAFRRGRVWWTSSSELEQIDPGNGSLEDSSPLAAHAAAADIVQT